MFNSSNKVNNLSDSSFALLKNAKKGDVISFGRLCNPFSGESEEILWNVLSNKDGKFFLLSKSSVAFLPFGSIGSDWIKSEIRSYLNGEFLNDAFSDKEREMLSKEETTGDTVFLISKEEYNLYVDENLKKCSFSSYTQLPYIMKENWYLRSCSNGLSEFVKYSGKVASCYSNESMLIRPAIIINVGIDDSINTDIDVEKIETLENPFKEGYTVEFGRCPMNADGAIKPIKWIVLYSEEHKALLLSKYGLFNSSFGKSGDWKSSNVQRLLNINFLHKFFNDKERCFIDIDKNIGSKVFLLSQEEYGNLDDLKCCMPTEFLSNKIGNRNPCPWWLRNSEDNIERAMLIDRYGSLTFTEPSSSKAAVRPAIWIKF